MRSVHIPPCGPWQSCTLLGSGTGCCTSHTLHTPQLPNAHTIATPAGCTAIGLYSWALHIHEPPTTHTAACHCIQKSLTAHTTAAHTNAHTAAAHTNAHTTAAHTSTHTAAAQTNAHTVAAQTNAHTAATPTDAHTTAD